MDISQIQTQQMSTQANQAATREHDVTAARSVSPELTETQQYEARQKYDTLELSNEGREALNNSQMHDANTKSLAMTDANQQPKESVEEKPEQKTATKSQPVDNLSSYSKAELRQLLNTGAISRAEYDAEIENREGDQQDNGRVDEANNEDDNSKTLGTNGKDDKSVGFGK